MKPLFGDPIGPWHLWFAWWPVRTYDHRLTWLETVKRRRIQAHEYLSHGVALSQWWQYAKREARSLK